MRVSSSREVEETRNLQIYTNTFWVPGVGIQFESNMN